MKVGVIGTGYVGLVTGACLAETGAQVICHDVDKAKIDGLLQGVIPIYEPGLEELVESNSSAGRLDFTTDFERTVGFSEVIFIAVGTPPDEDGSADLSYVLAVAREIGRAMDDYKLVVTKSTVPVGTAEKVRGAVQAELQQRNLELPFDVASNPEFLKEGAAIKDFMQPDRIVIGTDSAEAEERLRRLYGPYNRNHEKIISMDIPSAELTKYAANVMLAAKISMANELANIAEKVGADIENIRVGIGSDPRIGYHFIYAGAGYGGSCFPKDVRALEQTAREHGYDAEILRAIEAVNNRQKQILYSKVQRHFDGKLDGCTIAVWGLAFKPNTDDMRDAPSRELISALLAAGARVQTYDPEAMQEARRIFGDDSRIQYCDSALDAARDADSLVMVTEWKSFWSPDFSRLKQVMKQPVLFDGRNIWKPEEVAAQGFQYYGIGR